MLKAVSRETLGLRCSVNLCGGIWGFWSDACSLVTGPGWVAMMVLGCFGMVGLDVSGYNTANFPYNYIRYVICVYIWGLITVHSLVSCLWC